MVYATLTPDEISTAHEISDGCKAAIEEIVRRDGKEAVLKELTEPDGLALLERMTTSKYGELWFVREAKDRRTGFRGIY